jgi:PadR family transcriptional regulator PadR
VVRQLSFGNIRETTVAGVFDGAYPWEHSLGFFLAGLLQSEPCGLTKSSPIDNLYGPGSFSYSRSIGTFPVSAKPTNLLQGTLDLLILKALGPGELHGLGISRRIEQITQGTFLVKPGSLFPALHRMEEAGWLSSFWGESENNRRAKFYRLTKSGKSQLKVETEQWTKVALAMTNALTAT